MTAGARWFFLLIMTTNINHVNITVLCSTMNPKMLIILIQDVWAFNIHFHYLLPILA